MIGAAVVAAHNLALRSWLAAGAPAAGLDGCRELFRRVAGLLPVDGSTGRATESLTDLTHRLEQAVGRLERTAP